MPTQRQLLGIAQSAQTGRVFVRFRFNENQLDPLVEDLNYASTQGAIKSVTQLRQIGNRILDELKKNFPRRKSLTETVRSSRGYAQIRNKTTRLVQGWRVKFYDAAIVSGGRIAGNSPSLLGFYISHKEATNSRVRTILASLESGSRGYTIRPVNRQSLRFSFRRQEVFATRADIPARPGYGYLRKTEMFADQLLASKGSQMEQELVSLLEKGQRFKEMHFGRESVQSDPLPAIEQAVKLSPDSFGIVPRLRSIKGVKNKVRSLRFNQFYRYRR